MEETVKETKRTMELPAGTPLQIRTVDGRIQIEWDDVPAVSVIPSAPIIVDLRRADFNWAMLCRTCGGNLGELTEPQYMAPQSSQALLERAALDHADVCRGAA